MSLMLKQQMAEIAPGQLKPVRLCTPSERRRALALEQRKSKLVQRHGKLIGQLERLLQSAASPDEDLVGPRAASIPITIAALATGDFPPIVTLPVLEGELRELEQWIDELQAA